MPLLIRFEEADANLLKTLKPKKAFWQRLPRQVWYRAAAKPLLTQPTGSVRRFSGFVVAKVRETLQRYIHKSRGVFGELLCSGFYCVAKKHFYDKVLPLQTVPSLQFHILSAAGLLVLAGGVGAILSPSLLAYPVLGAISSLAAAVGGFGLSRAIYVAPSWALGTIFIGS